MMRAAALALAAALTLAACVEPARVAPPGTEAAQEAAWPMGFPGVRIWGDDELPDPEAEVRALRRQRAGNPQGDARLDILALSGGGAEGAFGAGFLNGWSRRGDRPEFDIVTGVSTGALIAPFAFLGPEHDLKLREFFTRTRTRDIARVSVLEAIFRGTAALADSGPLEARIGRELSDTLIAHIAAEHEKGRRLYIATTNLDAQRPVVWDIGQIAASGQPGAAELIRKVILASASIPVALPPVAIDATDGKTRFRELHADGAITQEIFVYPEDVVLPRLLSGGLLPRRRNFWLIHNGILSSEFETVTPRTLEIAERALDTLIKAQTRGDLARIEAIARRDGFRYNLATIPPDLEAPEPGEFFDPAYMAALFKAGEAAAVSADPWFNALAEVSD